MLLLLASLVGWESWEALRTPRHPWGDVRGGTFTDHFSHMNAARLFTVVGLDLWRKPIASLFPKVEGADLERLPADVRAGGSSTGGVYRVPGWPEGKPLVSSWTNNPRLYPPGDLLLVAPIALLYHHTSLSLAGACRLLLMWFVLFGHLAIFVLLVDPPVASPRWLGVLTTALFASEALHWVLEGFYDASALVLLLVAARLLARQRPLAAVVVYCAAAFLHFRAYFYAPWVLLAAWQLLRDRAWLRFAARDWLALAAAGVLAALSLGAFGLLLPTLGHLPVGNAVNLAGAPQAWAVALFLAATAGAGWAIARAGAFLDLCVLAWLTVALLTLREAYGWHAVLILLPWLGAPIAPSPRAAWVAGARFGFVLVATTVVFDDSVVGWLRYLL